MLLPASFHRTASIRQTRCAQCKCRIAADIYGHKPEDPRKAQGKRTRGLSCLVLAIWGVTPTNMHRQTTSFYG
ncbi:MAG: hypothetical protein ACREBW_00015, partial [Candidatus Micrarchaeaceae archaeon]